MKKLSKSRLLWIALIVVTALTVVALSTLVSADAANPVVYAQTTVDGETVNVSFAVSGGDAPSEITLTYTGIEADGVTSGDAIDWSTASAGITFTGLTGSDIAEIAVTPIANYDCIEKVYVSLATEFTASSDFEAALESASNLARTSTEDITVKLAADWTWTADMKIGSGSTLPYETSSKVIVNGGKTITSGGYLAAMFGNYEFNTVTLAGNGTYVKNGFFFSEGCKGIFNNITTDTQTKVDNKMTLSGGDLEINSGYYSLVAGVAQNITLNLIDNVTLSGVDIKLQGTSGTFNLFGGGYGEDTAAISLGKTSVSVLESATVFNRACGGSWCNFENALSGGTITINTSGSIGTVIASHTNMENNIAAEDENKFTLTITKGTITNVLGMGTSDSHTHYLNSKIIIDPTTDSDVTIENVYAGAARYNAVESVAKIKGKTDLKIYGGTFNGIIFGGSFLNNNADHIASSSLTIDASGTTFGSEVYGGSHITAGTHSGDTSVEIINGNFGEKVYAGSNVKSGAHASTSTLRIVGGSFSNSIMGGSSLAGGSHTKSSKVIIEHTGTIAKYVFGGSYVYAEAEHSGSSSIIANTSTTFSSYVFAGSHLRADNAVQSGASTLETNGKPTFNGARVFGGSFFEKIGDATACNALHTGESKIILDASKNTFNVNITKPLFGGSWQYAYTSRQTGKSTVKLIGPENGTNTLTITEAYGGVYNSSTACVQQVCDSEVIIENVVNGTRVGGSFYTNAPGGIAVDQSDYLNGKTPTSRIIIESTGRFDGEKLAGFFTQNSANANATITMNSEIIIKGTVSGAHYVGSRGGGGTASNGTTQTGNVLLEIDNATAFVSGATFSVQGGGGGNIGAFPVIGTKTFRVSGMLPGGFAASVASGKSFGFTTIDLTKANATAEDAFADVKADATVHAPVASSINIAGTSIRERDDALRARVKLTAELAELLAGTATQNGHTIAKIGMLVSRKSGFASTAMTTTNCTSGVVAYADGSILAGNGQFAVSDQHGDAKLFAAAITGIEDANKDTSIYFRPYVQFGDGTIVYINACDNDGIDAGFQAADGANYVKTYNQTLDQVNAN